MKKYKVFKRSCTNFEQFAKARKYTLRTGLSYEEAQTFCRNWNNDRSEAQIKAGTKAEFTEE